MLLEPGLKTYRTLVLTFYCNLSFTTIDGFLILRTFVMDQVIIISKTLINELFKFSNDDDDSTPNSMTFQNAKHIFVLALHSNISPTRQLTHKGLNLCGKLLHTLLVKTVYSRNSSCGLVYDTRLILKWKVATLKTIDYASLIISNMRFSSSP